MPIVFKRKKNKEIWFDLTCLIPRFACYIAKQSQDSTTIFCDYMLTIKPLWAINLSAERRFFSLLISYPVIWHLPSLSHQWQHDAVSNICSSRSWRQTTSQSCGWIFFLKKIPMVFSELHFHAYPFGSESVLVSLNVLWHSWLARTCSDF